MAHEFHRSLNLLRELKIGRLKTELFVLETYPSNSNTPPELVAHRRKRIVTKIGFIRSQQCRLKSGERGYRVSF